PAPDRRRRATIRRWSIRGQVEIHASFEFLQRSRKYNPRAMPLTGGFRLGPYEVVSALGAGGMGEVYRARDTKLNRDVAIKVLPEAVAADPDYLARFQREAQVLASLNHPNIAHI